MGLFLMVLGLQTPSTWVKRWGHLVPEGGTVLDVACGHGRHMRWFAERGHAVTGIDRSTDAIAAVSVLGRAIQLDIECDPWPLDGITFDAVVVTNYLWRPLLPRLVSSVAHGGILIYETFALGNESVGRPSRPDFLLNPGELLEATTGLRTVAYEDGFCQAPDRFVQRIVATRKLVTSLTQPQRHLLSSSE